MSVGLVISLVMLILAVTNSVIIWRSRLHRDSFWGVKSPETLHDDAAWRAGQAAAAHVGLRLAAALVLASGILVLTVGVHTSPLWDVAPAAIALLLSLGGQLARERAVWAAGLVPSGPRSPVTPSAHVMGQGLTPVRDGGRLER